MDTNGTIYKPMTLLQNLSEDNLKFYTSGFIRYPTSFQSYSVVFDINPTENDLVED